MRIDWAETCHATFNIQLARVIGSLLLLARQLPCTPQPRNTPRPLLCMCAATLLVRPQRPLSADAAGAAATLRLSHPAASALQRGPVLGCLWSREGNLQLEQWACSKRYIGEASVAGVVACRTDCSAAQLGLQANVECNHAIAVAEALQRRIRNREAESTVQLRYGAAQALQHSKQVGSTRGPAQLCSANPGCPL